ncbi:Catalase-peroxidase [Dirofilaria immitis]
MDRYYREKLLFPLTCFGLNLKAVRCSLACFSPTYTCFKRWKELNLMVECSQIEVGCTELLGIVFVDTQTFIVGGITIRIKHGKIGTLPKILDTN